MSILDFVEMSVGECIFCCLTAFFVCYAYSGIGYLFLKKHDITVQAVAGMTFVGAIVILCAEFCAGAAKYVIVTGAVTGIIVTIYRIIKKKMANPIISISATAVLFLIFIVHIFVNVVPQNGMMDYNCHLTYFSGIPLELAKADYFSRIRLMDIYPYVWSKYHFFNGSYTAIPLLFFTKYNLISYLFAKFLTVALYAGAIFELLRKKYEIKRATIGFILGIGAFFVLEYNGLTWSLSTNNYSCIFMFLIAWLLFDLKDYGAAAMFSIGFAVTKAGSILSGACLFLFGLFLMLKEDNFKIGKFIKREYKIGIYSIVVGLGVLATAFVGGAAVGENGISFGSIGVLVGNIFRAEWLPVVPMGGVITGSANILCI